LLTSYPIAGKPAINQLEKKVLDPLCQGKSSRNMVCTLCKPGEATIQQACTSSVQFTVSHDNSLDLTVTQRSSDVILGLPHDVIVWSTILHLVRREVHMRTKGQRNLQAGYLNFCISAGGAHVYALNFQNMETLLDREPKPGVLPHLVVDDSVSSLGMLELARTYDDDDHYLERKYAKLRVAGYGDTTCFHPRVEVKQAV
jgi:thymidylate synthase